MAAVPSENTLPGRESIQPTADSSARRRRLNVAVIGAGAAGLAAARELMREGHAVTVIEAGGEIGGVWAYDERIETEDLLGLDPNRQQVHSSMYASLRTNLPRELMGFLDFPFSAPLPGDRPDADVDPRDGTSADSRQEDFDMRRFPSHREVLRYLCRAHRSISTYRGSLGGSAGAAAGIGDGERVEGREEREEEREFDALVVCNGHYSQPKIATIAGVDTWQGIQMHSHNYRYPEGFAGKVVVVVGAEASGQDIARELAAVAREVHILQIKQANADGTVEFEDGFTCHADVIMHCTGYSYSFPFLALHPSLLSVNNGRVTPLFRHVLPPALAPSLSFIGLPWKVVPFPLCQLQARWVAQLLSGQLPVPPRSNMEDGVRRLYARMEEQGVPERYAHRLDMEQVRPKGGGPREK
ncbi:unnamed protein product [Closterium sp. Yama58-4]|nr:unnamed protein product [Closterium sp. Yama58-4]